MEYILKQRVTGAVVLVALAVIFVPMLLEGPSDTLVPEIKALPDKLEQPFLGTLPSFPAPDEIPSAPDKIVILEDTNEAAEKPDTLDVLVPPPAAPVSESMAEKPIKPVKSKQVSRWIVQAGSFSSQHNALVLRDRLRKANIATQVEKVRVAGKIRFRVQAGPFLERDEANQVNDSLKTKFNVKGRVFSTP